MRFENVEVSPGLVREIETLGRRWHDWRRSERQQSHAVELLGGVPDPRGGLEISVGREEFNVAGEIMVCLHAECGGFVRGRMRRDHYVYWVPHCACPACGQRYRVRDF
jgi:hypothetical protein